MEYLHKIIDFILHIDAHLLELANEYGIYIYVILFLILFLETGLVVTPFLPGDSLLFAAGALAAASELNIYIVIIVCFIGAVLGNQVNFYIGKKIGPKIFELNLPYVKKEYLEKTHSFYEKHGGKALIIGRFLPFIRTFVPFVAGVGDMNYARFTSYNILGAVLWVVPILLIGFWFGNIPFVKENFSIIVLIILILSILPMLFGIIKAFLSRNKG